MAPVAQVRGHPIRVELLHVRAGRPGPGPPVISFTELTNRLARRSALAREDPAQSVVDPEEVQLQAQPVHGLAQHQQTRVLPVPHPSRPGTSRQSTVLGDASSIAPSPSSSPSPSAEEDDDADDYNNDHNDDDDDDDNDADDADDENTASLSSSPITTPRHVAGLNQLAEDASIELKLFSQSPHTTDDISDDHRDLISSASAGISMIEARLRQSAARGNRGIGARQQMEAGADCIICYTESADTVFMPCKHLVVCVVCVLSCDVLECGIMG